MTHAEYVAKHGREPYDEEYWGPGGIDLSRWGFGCQRGLQYRDKGVDVGGPGIRRQFGGSRKARGMASDAYERGLRQMPHSTE